MTTVSGAAAVLPDMAMAPAGAGAAGGGSAGLRSSTGAQGHNHLHYQQQKQQRHQQQQQQQQQQQRHKRPPRACTARTPSRLAPVSPFVERATPRLEQSSGGGSGGGRDRSGSSSADPPTPMVLTSPPPPAQRQRWLIRSMWGLASITNFFNVFRPVLKLKVEFSMEELESALITPNALLDDIHMALLRAIPPVSRAPLNRETWVTVLCKKLKEWWHWVAEGPFPLAPYHGEELATYKELGPDVRATILKALCEARLDQDDIRAFIDDALKQGAPLSTFRKERMGVDMQGTTYWYENDPIAGQRLFRELRKTDNKDKDKAKIRGRLVPPPATCNWETLATTLHEFQTVADKLCSSKNRLEVAIGKRIINDIIPDLQELQKKKERALKKQQRQALLLDSYFNTGGLAGGLAAGRSKRERKPVTYTFDDYDKSISEAIKITKRRHPSPEPLAPGDNKASNGLTRQPDGEVGVNHPETRLMTEITRREAKPSEGTVSSDSEISGNGQSRRTRHHRKPQRYSENDFVEAVSDNEADAFSEDEIEGEAVYDDDYVQKKKRRKSSDSSDGDEEYRGDEEEEEEEEEEEDDEDDDGEGDNDSGSYEFSDDDYAHAHRRLKHTLRSRKRGKVKQAEMRVGLRRSQRATRSNVNYRKYEESDVEGDERAYDTETPQRIDPDRVENVTNSSEDVEEKHVKEEAGFSGQPRGDDNVLTERESDVQDIPKSGGFRPANGLKLEIEAGEKPGNKLRRYLDLNVAAPLGGGQDDGFHEGSSNMVDNVYNSEDDESNSDGPKS